MIKKYEVYYFDTEFMKWIIDNVFDSLCDAQKYIGEKHKENGKMYHLESVGIEEDK